MTDLPARIRYAADCVGGLNNLSKAIGVPRRTLGNWLSGRSPKPEALQKIASVSRVSLNWLVSGEGAPDDLNGGDTVGMLSRRRSVGQEIEGGRNTSFENDLAPNLHPDTVAIRRQIIDQVRAIHSAAGVTLANDDVAVIAMDVFATLMTRLRNPADLDEVNLVVAHLMHNLAADLSEARAKPGTGKRSA